MLKELDLHNVWNSQMCDSNTIKLFTTRLYSTYHEKWVCQIHDIVTNPKLRTYCKFKSKLVMEPYLNFIKDFKLRKILTRLRVSNHVLEIEKGRHKRPKIPVEERICKSCSMGSVEDEEHFLCVCPAYSQLRQEFVYKCCELGFYMVKDDLSLNVLMNCV